jgi:hypothetical protein
MSDSLATAIRDKVQLLNKKIQDRKTAEIFKDENAPVDFDYVTDILELSESQQGGADRSSETRVMVSILATMKSIAHTIQSKARWEKFVADHGDGGSIYTFSSRGDFSDKNDVTKAIIRHTNTARHIVMCTHLRRMEHLLEIATYITDVNTDLKRERCLCIYLDELDKYINEMRPFINRLAMCKCVEKIVIVTATPANIWSNHPGWSRLYVLNPRIDHDPDSYLMFRECRHINTDDYNEDVVPPRDWLEIPQVKHKRLIDHHHRILLRHPDILNKGRVIFAPGLNERKTHEYVAQFWNHFGCSVFVLNGERTSAGFYGRLYLCDGSVVDVQHSTYDMLTTPQMRAYVAGLEVSGSAQAQLNDVIADMFWKHHLDATPLIITGLLCVERAQSLVHPVWGTFTDGIYFWAANGDDAYQQQRQLGHIKKWGAMYRGVPRVFAPEQFRQDVLILEQRADVFSQKHGGESATVHDFISASDGALTSCEKRRTAKEEMEKEKLRVEKSIQDNDGVPFNNLKEVSAFLKKVLGSKIRIGVAIKGAEGKRGAFREIDGYLVSTRLLSHYKKKKAEELIADDRLTKEKYDRISRRTNISTNKGQHYMIYAVYPTMMSGPDEVKFYVRYLPAETVGGAAVDTITHA